MSISQIEIGQNYDARKAVSAILSVLKLRGAIFRPISSKVSVEKVFLCDHFTENQDHDQLV